MFEKQFLTRLTLIQQSNHYGVGDELFCRWRGAAKGE